MINAGPDRTDDYDADAPSPSAVDALLTRSFDVSREELGGFVTYLLGLRSSSLE